ncbi:hypothetical protein [Pseudomonas mandelii]|uniref:hypothetical protein n=1 Tax=Pseudomonas mandelii TaxID=75612 RepID=UPI003C78AF5A
MKNRPNILKFPTGLAVHLRFHKRVPAPQADPAYGVDYARLLPRTALGSMCGYGNAYSSSSCATHTPAWMSAPPVVLDDRPLSELPELAQVIICDSRFNAALAGDRHAVEAGHTEQVGESLLIVDAALLKAATESRPE